MQRRFFAFASRQRQLVKIILLQDVKDVGIRGEVVHVKRGHMRNYLYPWKHAVYAKGNENLDLLEHSAHIQEEQEKRELIKNIRQQIKSLKKMIPSSRIVLDYEPSETTDAKEEDASDEESFDVRKLQMPRFRAMVKEKTGLDIPETLIGLTDATQEETDDGLICKVPITLPEQNSVDLEVRVVSSAKKQ